MARKEKKFHFIYKTTNLLSGKYYIGMHSTDNLEDGYMGSGKRLRRSLNKYGKENHKVDILEFMSSRAELIAREKEIVCLDEIAKEECMNLMVGGKGGFISDEQQKRRSVAANKALKIKFENDPEFFKKHSERSSKTLTKTHQEGKIRYDTFTGKKHTEETKALMSKIRSVQSQGAGNSKYGTCWITKNGDNKQIKQSDLDQHLSEGWVRGRKIRVK